MTALPKADIGRCPLCDATESVEDSVPEPNLYSEKLAAMLGVDERRLLGEHSNWRCRRCGLIFKRRWFAEPVIRQLFRNAVPDHPKGWDAVGNRFTPEGFLQVMNKWADAIDRDAVADVRRGERELVSIIESIAEPVGFDHDAATVAVMRMDVTSVRAISVAVAASISEPAPFRRFAGFRSRALWDYLQIRTGGFHGYAEIGCPLWGLLALGAELEVPVTLLSRDEPNYWGPNCLSGGFHCATVLLGDRRVSTSDWSAPERYPVIGLFQYLDHLRRPRRFLRELFDKTDNAAIILDALAAPVAIQHATGWTDASLDYVASLFGKRLYTDFDDIRPSGNVLYLFAGQS
ncbi:MAG: hypothetical protein WCO86_17230 [Planctomycetota bacterium]